MKREIFHAQTFGDGIVVASPWYRIFIFLLIHLQLSTIVDGFVTLEM